MSVFLLILHLGLSLHAENRPDNSQDSLGTVLCGYEIDPSDQADLVNSAEEERPPLPDLVRRPQRASETSKILLLFGIDSALKNTNDEKVRLVLESLRQELVAGYLVPYRSTGPSRIVAVGTERNRKKLFALTEGFEKSILGDDLLAQGFLVQLAVASEGGEAVYDAKKVERGYRSLREFLSANARNPMALSPQTSELFDSAAHGLASSEWAAFLTKREGVDFNRAASLVRIQQDSTEIATLQGRLQYVEPLRLELLDGLDTWRRLQDSDLHSFLMSEQNRSDLGRLVGRIRAYRLGDLKRLLVEMARADSDPDAQRLYSDLYAAITKAYLFLNRAIEEKIYTDGRFRLVVGNRGEEERPVPQNISEEFKKWWEEAPALEEVRTDYRTRFCHADAHTWETALSQIEIPEKTKGKLKKPSVQREAPERIFPLADYGAFTSDIAIQISLPVEGLVLESDVVQGSESITAIEGSLKDISVARYPQTDDELKAWLGKLNQLRKDELSRRESSLIVPVMEGLVSCNELIDAHNQDLAQDSAPVVAARDKLNEAVRKLRQFLREYGTQDEETAHLLLNHADRIITSINRWEKQEKIDREFVKLLKEYQSAPVTNAADLEKWIKKFNFYHDIISPKFRPDLDDFLSRAKASARSSKN